MQPHEQRVIEELNELQGRIDRLGAFFASDLFRNLPHEERSDMRRQIGVMQEYADILARRISRF